MVLGSDLLQLLTWGGLTEKVQYVREEFGAKGQEEGSGEGQESHITRANLGKVTVMDQQ